jgi:hypothetical protein
MIAPGYNRDSVAPDSQVFVPIDQLRDKLNSLKKAILRAELLGPGLQIIFHCGEPLCRREVRISQN